MRIEALGPGAVHVVEGQEAVLVLPIAFHLDDRRGHWLRAVRIQAAALDSGVSLLRQAPVEVHPHGLAAAPIEFPVHLRVPADDEEGANRLDLHLPIRRPEDLKRLESGDVAFDLELDRHVAISHLLRFRWWTENGTVEVERLARVGSPLPLHLKIAALFLLLVGVTLWNQLQNQGVEAPGDVASWVAAPHNVDRIVFFLTGLFGIHLVGVAWSSIRSWLSFWRLPELYLNRELVTFLRSRLSTLGLVAAFALFAASAYWLRSVPLEKPDRRQSWWRDGSEEVAATRVYSRNVERLLLVCEDHREHPLAKAAVDDEREMVTADFVEYQATVVGGGTEIPAECATVDAGDRSVRFRFTAKDDFAEPCLRPFRREVRNLLCGRDWRSDAYRVSWAGSRAVVIEPLGEVGEGTLSRLIDESWTPFFSARRAGPEERDAEVDVLALARSAAADLDGRPISWSAFVSLYQRQMGEVHRLKPPQAIPHMSSLHVLLELYRLAPGEPIPAAFVDRLCRELLELYRRPARPWLKTVDKHLFRAHLRFLLALERELGHGPEAERLGGTVQDILVDEGYEFYMIYLEESVRTAQLYEGSCRTPASRARYGFVLERLRGIADQAPDLRPALREIRDRLEPRRASFPEELEIVGALLATTRPSIA